jgi:prophage regulatory protein
MTRDDRFIDREELLSMVPYTIQHIYRKEKAGTFPRRVRVGANRVAWVHSEILEWMKARIDAREGAS